MEKATLAGGCFWCIEAVFTRELGVLSVKSGYTGGSEPNPAYEEVCSGKTGHYEAVEIVFDPEKITFLQLLDIFWLQIDPTDGGGQFADRGSQYHTAIFYHDVRQQVWAEQSKNRVQALFSEPIATKILPAEPFYDAEEEHQGFCFKRKERYKSYADSHKPRLEEIWAQRTFSQDDLRERLTPIQYHVTQEEGTEPPFDNAYWDHKEEGIYVDLISGEPLFASSSKFDSGTGWPSFSEPIDPDAIIEHEDWSLGTRRVEVRGKKSGAHLGHVFPDGPTGLRYCINSAALRFIPKY